MGASEGKTEASNRTTRASAGKTLGTVGVVLWDAMGLDVFGAQQSRLLAARSQACGASSCLTLVG